METTTVTAEIKPLDIEAVRMDFPILQTKVYGRDLTYLDNAATTHKPLQVIERISKYYLTENSNVHRGVHYLSQLASDEYEAAREKIRAFINAGSTKEIVFTRGATESINLVASSFGRKFISAGDEIVITGMEHHANIVPWQLFCERSGAVLKAVPIDDNGELILEKYAELLTPRTKLVSIVHISNSLGTINPVEEIIRMAHERGIPVLLDGAQSIQHAKIDVRELDVDFFVFSGHKIYGPTGVGVLYGKEAFLEQMPPYQGGGDMIRTVTLEKTTYNDLPFKFEAGTPNIEGVIGLGTAIDYVNGLGLASISAHEAELTRYALEQLSAIPKLKIIGTAKKRAPVFSFTLEGIHPHDIGTILDFEGVAIRAGHHCTQPVMQRFGIPATARASFALYTTHEEIDRLIAAIHKVFEVFN
jgi:cysteine desulfurase/selenocysteine lyase